MSLLGKTIKRIRKEKKMTLTDVAGNQLSKGMLSLIENGKAQPSMESLKHIAFQLNVEVSTLVGANDSHTVREILKQAEENWKDLAGRGVSGYTDMKELIEPVIEEQPQTYEGARLLELYSRCMYELGNEYQPALAAAENGYKQIMLYNEYMNIQIFKAIIQYEKHEYSTAFDIILAARKDAVLSGWHLNEMVSSKLNYYEALLYYAAGRYTEGRQKLSDALLYMQKTGVFLMADPLYRLAVTDAFLNENEEEWQFYLGKLEQYAVFAEQLIPLIFTDYSRASFFIAYKQDYKKGLEIINECERKLRNPRTEEEMAAHCFLMLEKGTALFHLGKAHQALQLLEDWEPSNSVHHPVDLSNLYRGYALRALCYLEGGRLDEAVSEVNKSVRLIEKMPSNRFTDFILNTKRMIQQKIAQKG